MNTNLFEKINIDVTKTNVPNGCAADLQKECEAYDKLIEQSGGIDLQLLGIGLDGHIGFNEPGTPFSSKTHIIELKESTKLYVYVGGNGAKFIRWILNLREERLINKDNCYNMFILRMDKSILDIIENGFKNYKNNKKVLT